MTQDLAPHDHPPYGTPTEEQSALADAVRRALADATARRPVPPRHDALPVPLDADLWASLAGMDLLGLGVPEAAGGSGGGVQDLCVLLEEAGAAVAAVVPQARAGALALADGVVRGDLAAVPFGADADLVLAVATRDGAPVAVLLDLRADGVTRTAVPALDLGEPVAVVRVDGVRPDAVLEVGPPVARLLVRDAALLLDLGRSGRGIDAAARTAPVAALESAHAAARGGLQVHGGIGFT